MKKSWSYRAGTKPYLVTVWQERPGGIIRVRWWDRSFRKGRGNYTRQSLGRISQAKARRFADQKHLELKWAAPPATAFEPTLGNVFRFYLEHETPEKSPRVQADDRRRVELMEAVFGADTKPEEITPDDWREFRDRRLSGAIDARGRPAPRSELVNGEEEQIEPVPVRPRVVRADQGWLRSVCRWAIGYKVRAPGEGTYHAILDRNPLEGKSYRLTEDRNPRQPVITHTTHLVLLEKAPDVEPRLAALLTIANGTGRRLTPMISLWPHDRVRTKTDTAPFGGIRWPEDTDKQGREWFAPIDADTAAALDELERLIGKDRIAPYFESSKRAGRPISRDHARRWLLAAYELAGIEKPAGSCWHVYRRKFVTERPHMSDALIGALAGMSDVTVRIYRQSHPAGLYEALTTPIRLMEVRA